MEHLCLDEIKLARGLSVTSKNYFNCFVYCVLMWMISKNVSSVVDDYLVNDLWEVKIKSNYS